MREEEIRFLEEKYDTESSVAIFCETNNSRFLLQIESCFIVQKKEKIEIVSRSNSFECCVLSERFD